VLTPKARTPLPWRWAHGRERRAAGAKPQRRAGVQSGPQRHALGKAESRRTKESGRTLAVAILAIVFAAFPRFDAQMRQYSIAAVSCLLTGQAIAARGDKGGPGYRGFISVGAGEVSGGGGTRARNGAAKKRPQLEGAG
jgi:hypothetical protein